MAASANSVTASATPILDSGTRPKKVGRKKLVGTLFGFLLGIFLAMMLIASSNSARDARNPAPDYVFAFYFLAFALAVLLHELGHLLGGWSVGLRFSLLSVGPFSLRVEYGRLTIRVRREVPAGGYAGMHLDRVRRLRHRLLIFTAAGPAANLFSAAVAAVFLNYLLPAAGSNWESIPTRAFLQVSLILGLLNLAPFRSGMLFTDGARIAMLLRSRARSRRWMCIAAVGSQGQRGIRSKHWKRTWLKAAGSVHDGSVDDFSGNWIGYAAANDRKDASAAALHLERCLALMGLLRPSTQDVICLEAAVFTAWFRRDPSTAQKWVGQVKKLKAVQQLLRIRADVALLSARSEFDSALVRWQEVYAFIEKLPANPVQGRLKDSFQEWRDEILERQREEIAPQTSGVGPQTSDVRPQPLDVSELKAQG